MIIDCHGHYTKTPGQLGVFRKAQLGRLDDCAAPPLGAPDISDGQIQESIEDHHLRVMDERGIDLVLFSPRASGMEHHIAHAEVATTWARTCNDLIYRVTELFPDRFAGVCQLPQTPGGPLDSVIAELDRCVTELGFVGCNLNPDPSGGNWTGPPMTDEYWYPLYDKMVELDVPAMIHVSSSCNPNFHTLGAHYLNADTTVFMQLVQGDLFDEFPELRFVIPHGGGAVPYHWGRYEGLVTRMQRPPLREYVLGNVFFDTCVYHQAGIDLLYKVVPLENLLFASEMLGAVRGTNPDTGSAWDDTLKYVDRLALSDDERGKLLWGNVTRVYPRLTRRLESSETGLPSHRSEV